MLKGAGQLPGGTITCPLHRWSYSSEGRHLGAPEFPDFPCLDLPRQDLQKWNGMLFNGKRDVARDLAKLGVAKELDFEGYLLGVHQALGKPGSDTYKNWHEQVLKYRNGDPPPHGAIWLTYYPNVMVEWYPNVLVISTLHPTGPDSCRNVIEFYYPEEIALFEPEYMAAQQKAYHETALEDEEICARMTEGRKALLMDGREEHGPYQSPMEDGMVHFHEFIRREIGQHV